MQVGAFTTQPRFALGSAPRSGEWRITRHAVVLFFFDRTHFKLGRLLLTHLNQPLPYSKVQLASPTQTR